MITTHDDNLTGSPLILFFSLYHHYPLIISPPHPSQSHSALLLLIALVALRLPPQLLLPPPLTPLLVAMRNGPHLLPLLSLPGDLLLVIDPLLVTLLRGPMSPLDSISSTR